VEKIAYIIPGFDSNKDRTYWKVAAEFRKKGIRARVITIKWKNRVMSDYVREFIQKTRTDNVKKRYVLGHSFGAMIGFIAATEEMKPYQLILCSLSPYFKEDLHIKRVKKWRKGLGERRWMDLEGIKFNELAGKCKCKVTLIVGSKEWKEMKERTAEAKKRIRGSKVIVIQDAEHDIAGTAYFDAVKKYISKLR